jgi:DNA invertase Pin-like site-specific DNA recombinase
MMAILDRMVAGEIQAIIVQDLGRLARPLERAIFETIRNICPEYRVIVYSHSGKFDFADYDSDFVADIQMAVAKNEVKRIRKRLERGRDARAKSGGFFGQPPTGYKVAFVEAEAGRKPVSDLEIDPESAGIVRLIFELALKHYDNLSAVPAS